MLLRVTPTKPDLPTLKYSRFWTLRANWTKAVGVVAGYIDEELNTIHKGQGGALAEVQTSSAGRVLDDVSTWDALG